MVETKFKQTDIGLIPEDWEVKDLGELGAFKNGINKSADGFGFGYPFINLMDVFGKNIIISNSSLGLINSNNVEKEVYNLKKGDVIFIRSSVKPSGVGKTAVINCDLKDTVYSGFLIRYRNDSLNTDFKRYCFDSRYFRNNIISGSTISANTNINQEVLKVLKLAYPKSLKEQQAIAEVLSDTDTWIESLEQLIAKKQLIKQGAMQKLLTPDPSTSSGDWEVKKLGEICEIVMGQSPLSQFYNQKEIGLPLIQGNADIENRKTIIRNFTSQITKKGNVDDIIMSVRAPVGEIAKATTDCCLGRGVCALRYFNDFLYHYMVFAENQWHTFSTGSTFDSVNSSQIIEFEINIPKSFSEQIHIATILSDMDAEIEALENKLTKAQQIKQGLMQELLTGKIRLVQADENKETKSAKGHNEYIADAVLIGTMASCFASEQFPLTRFKYTKVSYLLKRYKEEQTTDYLKKAAGPYNPKTRYGGAEKIAKQNKYVAVKTSTYKGKNYEGFITGENVAKAIDFFKKWYGDHSLEWIKQFKFETNDNLELWATVDMAIQDLKKENKAIGLETVKQVIKENKEWRDKLKRPAFSDKNIESAIGKVAILYT